MVLPILKNQLIQTFLKICRVGGDEPHPFARGWMDERQRFSMECRPGDQDRFRRAIQSVCKQWKPDCSGMCPDLMRAAGPGDHFQ